MAVIKCSPRIETYRSQGIKCSRRKIAGEGERRRSHLGTRVEAERWKQAVSSSATSPPRGRSRAVPGAALDEGSELGSFAPADALKLLPLTTWMTTC